MNLFRILSGHQYKDYRPSAHSRYEVARQVKKTCHLAIIHNVLLRLLLEVPDAP